MSFPDSAPGSFAEESAVSGAQVLTDRAAGADLSASNPSSRRIAALFVDPNGVYSGLPNVEIWDEARDARLYDGPWPVVAHPPCARWSRLAGFTEARFGYKRGADGGCFAVALASVRRWGGVLEHPAYSAAWDAYGLPEPSVREGWCYGLHDGGASCYVEQGRYGLPVKKATWLYAHGVDLPELRWGYKPDAKGEWPNGPRGGIDRWRDAHFTKKIEGYWKTGHGRGLTATTPPAFRDELLAMARTVQTVTPATVPRMPSAPTLEATQAARETGGR